MKARAFIKEHKIRGGGNVAVVVASAFECKIQVSVDNKLRALLTFQDRERAFGGYRTSINHRLAQRATDQKEVASRMLRHRGIAAAENLLFPGDDWDRAWDWAHYLVSVVVKPNNADQGNGVHAGIDNYEEFVRAFHAVANRYGSVLVEQFLAGTEHRVLVVNGRYAAATRRVPANVLGDGHRSIAQLVDLKNKNVINVMTWCIRR